LGKGREVPAGTFQTKMKRGPSGGGKEERKTWLYGLQRRKIQERRCKPKRKRARSSKKNQTVSLTDNKGAAGYEGHMGYILPSGLVPQATYRNTSPTNKNQKKGGREGKSNKKKGGENGAF